MPQTRWHNLHGRTVEQQLRDLRAQVEPVAHSGEPNPFRLRQAPGNKLTARQFEYLHVNPEQDQGHQGRNSDGY